MSVGDGELLDCAIRRRGVNMLAVWIGGRGAVGDLGRAGPRVILRRRVFPQNDVSVGVYGDRFPVSRRDEKYVAVRSADRYVVQVNGGGVHGPVDLDLASFQRIDVAAVDAAP